MTKLIDEKYIQLILIETLSFLPTAGIIQISACRFSIQNNLIESNFQVNIKPQESKYYNLDINQDVVNFWLTQPFEIKALLLQDTEKLPVALNNLSNWIDNSEKLIYYPTFAIPALINAFSKVNQEVPWKHYNILDLQTIFTLSSTKIEKVEPRNSLKQCELFANNLIKLFNGDE